MVSFYNSLGWAFKKNCSYLGQLTHKRLKVSRMAGSLLGFILLSFQVLAQPVLSTPYDYQWLLSSQSNVNFTWGSVTNATSYRIQLAYADVPFTASGPDGTTGFATTLNGTTNDGESTGSARSISIYPASGNYYAWAVRSNLTNTYSAKNIFVIRHAPPPLLQPINNATITNNTTFSWLPVDNADRYRIQVSNSPSIVNVPISDANYGAFVSTVYNEPLGNITDVSFSSFNLTTPGTYYWHVRGGKETLGGEYSEVRSFTIPTPILDSVSVKFRVTVKGTGRKIHPMGMRITGALGASTQPDWMPSSAKIMVLESPTSDSIYTATIKIPRRTAPNDVYEFKYVNGDAWGDGSNGTPEDERNLTLECRVSLYWNRVFTIIPLPATSMTLPCYIFNTCTVYTQSVLSVEFMDVNVTHKNGVNIVAWQTTSEQNSDHFDIERSTDGKQFIKIGAIKAFGTTNQVQNYTYLDALLPPQYNVFYYRLRQVNKDNKAEYSPIRSISIDKQDKPTIKIYPNPNNGQFVAFVPTSDKETDITIQNSHGQVIWKGNIAAGQKSQDILLDQAANGLYFVSCRNSEGLMKTTKFVINR